MAERKTWGDFTTGQQTALVLAGGLEVTLLASALWDMWHRPAEEIKGDRRLWTLAAFINILGPAAYFVFGRKRCC